MGSEGPAARALRVLMLAPSYHPRAGGVEKHVKRVSRELAARGVEVRIATPRWEDAWLAEELVDGIAVTRLAHNRRAGTRALAPLAAWADLIHAHDAYAFLKYYLPYRLRRPGTPVFVTFHGYEGYPIPLEARVLRRIVLWLSRGTICAGAFIPKWYHFRCRHVTHGGVDAPPRRTAPGEGAVFVGRLEPDTGCLDYLRALSILKQEHGLAMPLEVCGDGSLRAEAEELARSSGLQVTFHGRVADVMPYLARAEIAFVSGLLAILEAMASGAVVCAVYDNPLKEDYLRLFPGADKMLIAGSADELAAGLLRLRQTPGLQQRMAAEAYDFAASQTWGKVADLYLDLYRSDPRLEGRL